MDSPGLRFLDAMLMDLDEIQFMQAERERLRRAGAAARTAGLLIPVHHDGHLDDAWQVHDDDDDGSIEVRYRSSHVLGDPLAAYAIDTDGYPRRVAIDEHVESAGPVALANDDTWRTVLLRWVATTYAEGTISFTAASTAIAGLGTKWTHLEGYTSGGLNRGTLLRVDPGDTTAGNDGTWELDDVIDDDTASIRSAAVGTEVGVRYHVQGRFSGPAPGDPDIHLRWVPDITVVARTADPPAGYLVLADVKRNDAASPKVQVLDRRAQSLARLRDNQGPALSLQVASAYDAATSALVPAAEVVATGNTDHWYSAVPCGTGEDGGVLASRSNGGLATFGVQRWSSRTGWAAMVTIVGAQALRLLPLPRAFGDAAPKTHIAVYQTSTNILYAVTSTDDGDTWSAPSAIWTANVAITLGSPHIVRLNNGRIAVVATYANLSTPSTEIRFVYSDDLGVSWQTNAGAGFVIADWPSSGSDPLLDLTAVAIDRDGYVWTFALDLNDQKMNVWIAATTSLPTPGNPTVPDYEMEDFAALGGVVRSALAAPTGGVLAVGDDNTTGRNVYTVMLRRDPSGAIMHTGPRVLFVAQAASVEANAACLTPDGEAHVLVTDRGATPDALYHLRCHAIAVPLPPQSY